MAEIKIENVSYIYGEGTPYEIKALDNINLTIKSGRTTGIIGHTGSGKSTLVQMLNGLVKPNEGKILLGGCDIWENPKEINKIRYRVGLCMQYPEYQLFEETIKADIAYGPRNMGLDDEEISGRVLEAADFVGLESDLLDKSPFDLSGGQKRRAAIAGVIAMGPEVLVLDEPAAGLDPRGRDIIMDGIKKYRDNTDATVVIVSHSMEDMAKYCDDIIVMNEGRVYMSGEKEKIFAEADKLTAVGLDIPQVTKVMNILKNSGIDINPAVFTIDDALIEINKFI